MDCAGGPSEEPEPAWLVHPGNRGNSTARPETAAAVHGRSFKHQIGFEERKEFIMADTTIIGDRVGVVQAPTSGSWSAATWSGLSWSAVIAGALTAVAVTIIVVALGSGIGFTLASPWSASPTTSTLTVLGGVWLVFAQAIGFAVGGYVAGRLRRDPAPIQTGETKFRDGVNGLVVWAIGVVVGSLLLVGAADKIGSAAATSATAGAAAAGMAAASGPSGSIDYFADTLLRASPQGAVAANAAPAGATPGNAAPGNDAAAMHAQIGRILIKAAASTTLASDDRTYLAQIVSARTGMSMDDAQKRVDDVVNQARASVTEAADKAGKAAAFLAFWTFMSLLFGAACATLGGILGGDLRDEWASYQASPPTARP